MKGVLLLDGIGPEAEPILAEAGLRVVDAAKGFKDDSSALLQFIGSSFQPGELQAICLRSGTNLNDEVMPALRGIGVELVVRFGTGVDNVDLKAACSNGIIVENTPGQNATSVAEKTVICAGLLCHAMNLPTAGFAAVRAIKAFAEKAAGLVSEEQKQAFAEMTDLLLKSFAVRKTDCKGSELCGKTMGVVGCCGAIGLKVSTRAMGLGMNVLGYDPRRRALEAEGVKRVRTLQELLAQSDFVTIHVPLNADTRELIGMEQIMMMKKKAFLLNLARAGIVDIGAVDADLSNPDSCLGGYASDVDDPNDQVFRHASTVVMPHIGASSKESETRCAITGTEQVVSWLKEGDIINGCNLPDSSLSGRGKNGQLTVIHHDSPGLIERLSGYFSEHGVNIGPFHTAPQDGFACTMIGPDEPFDDKVVLDIASMEGIVRVMPLVH
jgi:D-3-phosphoglycerate dehydrogenase